MLSTHKRLEEETELAPLEELIRLADKYSPARMEAAAQLALLRGACRYRSIASILKNSLDRQPLPTSPAAPAVTPPRHDHLPGPQEFVRSGILRGFPDFLKSDVFSVGHSHALRFQ